MKIWNLNVKRGADGSKHLDIQMHGVIDDAWGDDGVDSADIISELNQHLDAKTVQVRINSIGGSAFGGIAMYNALQSHPGEVETLVEGLAASAASLVAMAGRCVMGVGSMMMIHPPLTIAMGNADELRKTADVLDKVQEALASIYTEKTGKSLDEINAMLDAETWMTAEEAVAAGFADAISNAAAEEDPDAADEPDPNDPNEGNEDEPDDESDEPEMLAGGAIRWRGAVFPAAKLPQQIIAMARKPAPAAEPRPAPALAIVSPPAPQPPISRAELALRSPELLAALLDEGRAAGAAAERARLQAIDELGVKGCDDIIAAAKYGDKPTTAADVAMAVVKAGKLAGAEILAARRAESRVLTDVTTTAPDQTATAAQSRIVAAITEGGNSMRGGKIR